MDAVSVPIDTLVGFLLALVRTASWMVISPPFNTRLIPRTIKVGVAAAISMPLASQYPASAVNLEPINLLTQVFMQMATGLMLGFLTFLLFSAVQQAGALIDQFGGFTMTMSLDPFLNAQSSVFAKFYNMMAMVLLFAINGHLLLIKGFMTSFDTIPISGASFTAFFETILDAILTMGLAAVEIAGPLLAAYFLAEVALGLLTKAAPQLQILQFGFPFKILLTILLVGAAMPLLPGSIENLVDHILRAGVPLLRSSEGGEA